MCTMQTPGRKLVRSITKSPWSSFGNRWVPSSTVRKSISIHPGDVYDSAEIESDVAALKKTGYFDNVRAETKDDEWTKDGKMVTFHVREKKDLILPHAP